MKAKQFIQKNIYLLPLISWFVIIPVIVKMQLVPNPLADYSWYNSYEYVSDFFLYHKSIWVNVTGFVMLAFLAWQIGSMRHREALLTRDTRIFIPLFAYLLLGLLSSIFSEYRYFSSHGMPDQFETAWNLIAYIAALVFCYYVVAYQDSEKKILACIFAGAALVGAICVAQRYGRDIYRMIYEGDGYTFTFPEGMVYGPFYNVNYVGYYTLLFLPIFFMLVFVAKNWLVKIASAALSVMLFISMSGAESVSAKIALAAVAVFFVLFMIARLARNHRAAWIGFAVCVAALGFFAVKAMPGVRAYIASTDLERRNLEHIFTYDDKVEIDYLGNTLYASMFGQDEAYAFELADQDGNAVACEYASSPDGFYYYAVTDSRFPGFTLTPIMIAEDPVVYGFSVAIDGKTWTFTDQITDGGGYYYFNDLGKFTKLDEDSASDDFGPLVHMAGLASGRGFIWNKSIAVLKKYLLFGSGKDTFALAFPNGDFVDRYNNGYDNMFITKPHSLYLQIGVETGVLSLVCFLVFYAWYFFSSARLYFKRRLDSVAAACGFAIMLGTLGYMISALANDSTITISPLYWALLGIGIGINHRLSDPQPLRGAAGSGTAGGKRKARR